VTRKDLEGNPPNGLTPPEKLDVRQAIQMYTANGAYGAFEEGRKGVLAEGCLADLVVLSEIPSRFLRTN
jgi:predicted amidohydrolase YtcJ